MSRKSDFTKEEIMFRKMWWCGVGLMLALLMSSCKPETQPVPPAVVVQQAAQMPVLAGWALRDARDPQVNEVVTGQGETYAIDPNWNIKSIHYLYKWWGLGDPVFDYQAIEREGDQFKRGAEVVTTDDVQAFLKSINALYPSQMLLGGNSWTDDYPSWAIEIVGEDGRRVQLFSSSTGNAGDGPWNVLDNGRLYAQYDGSLAAPLSKLFTSQRGEPAAAFVPGGHQPNTTVFGTTGFPEQMLYGFSGLLPIADGFGYTTNVVSGTLEGFVQGRSSIGGMGHMVIGSVTGLTRVELTLPDGSPSPCTIDPVTQNDPASAVWKFVCTPGAAQPDRPYRFPIAIELGTDKDEHFTTTGEVWGKWEAHPDSLYSPLSAEVQAALEANDAARDLLKDHIPAIALYQAEISMTPPLSGTVMGEVVLLGSTTANGAPLRYTIGTPFTIENGQLTRWGLTRAALEKMLHAIEPLPLTQRILKAAPTAQLNMWYAEAGDDAKMFPSITGRASQYGAALPACGSLATQQLPRSDEPLRAFGFNNGWAYYMADFVLIDGKPVANELDLWPGRDDRDGVLPLLLPEVFATTGQPTFRRVWVSNGFGDKERTLMLYLPEKMSPEERAAYDKVARSLPGKLDQKYDTWWEVSGATLAVNDEGKLEVAACQ
jgi:hypothetical protein